PARRTGIVPAGGWMSSDIDDPPFELASSLAEANLRINQSSILPCPSPASRARMTACARSATCSLLKMLETWFPRDAQQDDSKQAMLYESPYKQFRLYRLLADDLWKFRSIAESANSTKDSLVGSPFRF